MPAWAWIVIAAGVVVALVVIATTMISRKRRTQQLQGRFGPEYERTLESSESKRKAEAELAARAERRQQLDIRPLSHAARTRYVERWQSVQAEFVDHPSAAVTSADALIQSVMADRGYPVEDFDQRAADVSVDHPDVVEHYREGHRLAQNESYGDGSTEDLRQAMRHYRALFDELVEPGSDEPMTRSREADEHHATTQTDADGRVAR